MGGASGDKNLFGAGDMALLLDRKNRRYLQTLSPGQTFHSHLGQLPHDSLIDCTVGGWYRTDRGHVFLAVRPTLGDFVLEMPRGPQIIYPKDLGNIITLADIFPGATVVEAGLGSGSLTAALLRAVGSQGRVVTYEINEKTVVAARRNIEKVTPDASNLTVTIGDIYQGIAETDVDRIVLDVPEPWQAVGAVAEALVMGGIFLSFLPHRPPGPPTRRGTAPGRTFPDDRDRRDLAPALARCRAERPSGPPDGRPQRLPHHRRPLPAPGCPRRLKRPRSCLTFRGRITRRRRLNGGPHNGRNGPGTTPSNS